MHPSPSEIALSYNASMGRPTVITPDVVAALTEAFKLDVTVEETCQYARISKDTYYRCSCSYM